jgi:hypothetical protein
MAFQYTITENLPLHMQDEVFLEAYHAWTTWDKPPGGKPRIGGQELADLQASRNLQMRLVQKGDDGWLCTDFAPSLVDLTGYSLAGAFLRRGEEAFVGIHIDNADLAFANKKPVYCVFKSIKAPNVETWQALYLPVRYRDTGDHEIIVIGQPILYRQPYLEQLINGLPFGLMAVLPHPVDGQDHMEYKILEGNRPLARLFGHSVSQLSGMRIKDLWPDADHGNMQKMVQDVLTDGEPRRLEDRLLTEGGEERALTVLISKASQGLTFSIWDQSSGMCGGVGLNS